jgi:hypothetical protein
MTVVQRIGAQLEEEAEDNFQPSLDAAQGSIASAAAHDDIFVTKEQAAELYAGMCACMHVCVNACMCVCGCVWVGVYWRLILISCIHVPSC